MNERVKKWFSFRPWERHSLVLMVGGFVYIFVGLAFINATHLTATRELSMAVALRHAPLSTWGFIFAASGVLAIVSAKWPGFSDRWGYMILTGLSSGWAGMYLFNYIFYFTDKTTLTYGLLWGLMAFLWWAISGW
jgi:hypothetical protein